MKLKLCVLALAAIVLAGCPSSSSSESAAPKGAALRSVVVTAAKGIVEADRVCSSLVHVLEAQAGTTEALKVADKCSNVARDALAGLATAEEALDTYDAAKASQIVCAIGHASNALATLDGLLEAHGFNSPQVAKDALELAGVFGGGACPVDAGSAEG